MTRKQLSDLCKLRLNILGADTRIDERVLWRLADSVRKKLLTAYVVQFGSESRGHWTKTVIGDVELDTATDLRYTEIDFIDTPDGSEIVSVSKTHEIHNPFIPQSVGQSAVYSGLEAADVITTWWHEAGRIYFNGLGFEVTQVAVRCSPSISSLTDDEDIPMPTAIEDDMIEGVAAKIMSQPPVDKVADTR